MISAVKMIRDADRYEARALAWLLRETEQLVHGLRQAGLSDSSTRTVAENYLFGLACRLDGAEGAGDVRLCFAEGDELLHSESDMPLHDFVLGTVDELVGDEG